MKKKTPPSPIPSQAPDSDRDTFGRPAGACAGALTGSGPPCRRRIAESAPRAGGGSRPATPSFAPASGAASVTPASGSAQSLGGGSQYKANSINSDIRVSKSVRICAGPPTCDTVAPASSPLRRRQAAERRRIDARGRGLRRCHGHACFRVRSPCGAVRGRGGGDPKRGGPESVRSGPGRACLHTNRFTDEQQTGAMTSSKQVH